MTPLDYAVRERSPRLSPEWDPDRVRATGRASPASVLGTGVPVGGVGVRGELLADVAGAEAALLAPVGVPVRPVRAAGAVLASAPNVLLSVRHLPRALHVGPGVAALAGDEEPPDEDQETPEVELVEVADLAHEVTIDRHLRPECPQEPKSSNPDRNQTEREPHHPGPPRSFEPRPHLADPLRWQAGS